MKKHPLQTSRAKGKAKEQGQRGEKSREAKQLQRLKSHDLSAKYLAITLTFLQVNPLNFDHTIHWCSPQKPHYIQCALDVLFQEDLSEKQ